jgi:DNA-binding transcriptional LysR family regulator
VAQAEEISANYPDIKVEVMIDYGFSDIVAQCYDMGVRLGDEVAKDMIAARIGPDARFVVVGSRSYLAKRPAPKTPQELAHNDCINLHLPTYGASYAWKLKNGKRELRVRVEGQFVFNGIYQVLEAAKAGFGLAFVPEEIAQAHVTKGPHKRCLKTGILYFPAPLVLSESPPSLRKRSSC